MKIIKRTEEKIGDIQNLIKYYVVFDNKHDGMPRIFEIGTICALHSETPIGAFLFDVYASPEAEAWINSIYTEEFTFRLMKRIVRCNIIVADKMRDYLSDDEWMRITRGDAEE